MRRRTVLASLVAGYGALRSVRASAEGAIAISGDRFRWGGSVYRLADIIAPSAYGKDAKPAPYFRDARDRLQALLSAAPFVITRSMGKSRWGETIASFQYRDEEGSLAALMVEAGAAQVAPQSDDFDGVETLLQREAAARAQRRGIWELSPYRPLSSGDAWPGIGGFHLVEGTVIEATEARGRFYINFGEDYRKDFTASAPVRLVNKWRASGRWTDDLQGRQVVVRGHIALMNGPAIILDHPLAISLTQNV